jgi:hypothetical protein
MDARVLPTGSALVLVAAGLFVSLPASAVGTTCQGRAVTIAAAAHGQEIAADARGRRRPGAAQDSLNSFALDEASLHVPVRAVENRVWVVAANQVGALVPARSIAMVAERVGVPVEMRHGAGEARSSPPTTSAVPTAPT